MIEHYAPLIELDGGEYYPEPYSAVHLAKNLRHGLIPLGLLATLSVASSLALIIFIVTRIIMWRRHYRTFVGYNQYVVLVLNLLIADLQQGSSFLISWHWYRQDRILAPSPACFAQGWMLHSGDVSSGLFVLAIAIHTHYTAVYGQRLGHKAFAAIVISIWILVYFLTAIGVGLHGQRYFVRAGAWCWVSSAYESDRLWCHYIWVFIVEFGTIAIYLKTFWSLRQKTRRLLVNGRVPVNSPNAATIKAVNRITMLMTLYPCVYVVLTLPLSAGRMWSMNHNGKSTSDVFSVIAGSLLTSCGWVDSLLYTLTRKRLLQDTMPQVSSRRDTGDDGWDPHELESKGITHTRTVTVEAGALVDFEMMPGSTTHRGAVLSTAFERADSPTGSIDPILSGKGVMPGVHVGDVTTEITGGVQGDEKIYELESPATTCSHEESGRRKFTDESGR